MKKIDSTTFKTILCVVALFVGGWVSSRPCVWWPHSWFYLFSSYWLLFWGTSSHMCLSFFQFSWWLSTSGPETSGLEWMLCRWWFWRLDEIVVDQLRKSDTLFDFWHRVLISLSCLPSSVNISIPNILLNTIIIFNLNHNLVHRTLSLLIPVHFRHLLFIHDDMYMYCSVYSQTQPFPTWFIQ